jgi:CelD/BcsL family acetyltransferase involved in cellulose biosynthesis
VTSAHGETSAADASSDDDKGAGGTSLAEVSRMDRTTLDLIAARDPRVEPIWRSLEAGSRPPFFLSWGWIENWLAVLPVDETPSLAVLRSGGEPRAAFFVARRQTRRHLVQQTKTVYFNVTGSPRLDGAAIERNGLLAAPGVQRSLSTIVDLLPGEWDELVLPAVDRYAFDDLGAASLAERYNVVLEREELAPFVDLEAVRTVQGGYPALLPASTRTQLQRLHGVFGELELEHATTPREAMDIYGELLRLHARRWAARGRRGAFADPWVERFHRRLILTRAPHGEIQLVRVKSKGGTLGCLYNLVSCGRVLFYQCGLASLDDPQLKPGYACHAALVEYNARAGHATYDLIGGQAVYKDNLGTSHDRLMWLRVQRPLARFALEDSMKRWYDLLMGDRRLALQPA